MTGPQADLAWAWVEHLRAGGTTPWRDFRSTAPTLLGSPAGPGRGRLPGAAQLELARRLNEDGHDDPALVDRVLARSRPGRGVPELPFDHGGDPDRSVGAQPVDPSDVPAPELLRVGVGVLVTTLLETEPPELIEPVSPRRPLFGTRFWVAGAPTSAAGTRAALADLGHPAGGRSPEIVLLALPLELQLGQVWSARVQRGAPVHWREFVARWVRQDALPPAADLPDLAASWAAEVGPDRVHIVLDRPHERAAAELLGLAPRRGRPDPGRPPTLPDLSPLSAAAVDVLARVNELLGVRVAEDRHAALRGRVCAVLPMHLSPDGGPAVRVDDDVLRIDGADAWRSAQAARVIKELTGGGYPVHGDLDRIAERLAGPVRPRPAEVLSVVLTAIVRVADREAGHHE